MSFLRVILTFRCAPPRSPDHVRHRAQLLVGVRNVGVSRAVLVYAVRYIDMECLLECNPKSLRIYDCRINFFLISASEANFPLHSAYLFTEKETE